MAVRIQIFTARVLCRVHVPYQVLE